MAYPCNPISGVFGAAATVAGAAVTIGTAPLVILAGQQPHFADYTCGRHYHEARYYGPQPGYYAPPPRPPTTPGRTVRAGIGAMTMVMRRCLRLRRRADLPRAH